ncbi:MAG: hypothetical protein ACLTCQ_06035 [Enterocloster bolteae]
MRKQLASPRRRRAGAVSRLYRYAAVLFRERRQVTQASGVLSVPEVLSWAVL